MKKKKNLGAKLVVIVVCLVNMIQVGMQDATEHPFEYIQVDIIVLLDDTGSIDDNEFGQLTAFIGKITEKFPMDGGKLMRLALITFSDEPIVRTPNGFVTTAEQFKEALDHAKNDRKKGYTQTQVALPKVKQFFLQYDERPDVPNVLLIMTDGCTNGEFGANALQAMADAEKTAKEMLDNGVKIFVCYVSAEKDEDMCSLGGNATEHQLILTGNNPDHRIKYDNFDQLGDEVFDAIKKEGKPVLCVYIPVCYYSDNTKTTCNGDWVKNVSASHPNCTETEPPLDDCDVTDCERHCDERWQTENCNEACEEMPEMPEWCKDACERCKLTENPEIETEPEPETELTTTAGPPEVVEEKTQTSSDNSGFPLWAIMLIAICVLLLFIALAILVGVMAHRRSRRRQIRHGGHKGKTAGGDHAEDKMKSHRKQQPPTTKTTLSKKAPK